MRETEVPLGQKAPTGSLMGSPVLLLFFIASYLLFAAGGLRMISSFYGTPYRWYIIGLLAAYFILLSTERILSKWLRWYQPVYFTLQTLIVLAMARAQPIFDYYAILFPGLYIQAIWFSPRRATIFWVSLFTLSIFLSEISLFGLSQGISYSLTYLAAGFFISVLGVSTLRAEQARAESQALLAELQVAHRKLKEYADQVEELAVVQERNRLARELHDSVTQTIFSMTLTAQSALILIDRDPGRVKEQLTHLQALSKSALAEMRALIQQLHPRTIAEEGLVAALQRHAAERKEKEGLAVEVKVLCVEELPGRFPVEVEESLYRVVQEALNNVVKHAKVDQATVTLDLRANPASVLIEDQGAGFDPRKLSRTPGHLGLTSMEERVRALGGRLTLDTKLGGGTRIRIDDLRMEERDHA